METKGRHLACSQIKIINNNADKMAVYYKIYKKIFIETGKLQGFASKLLLILELQTLPL